MDADDCPTAQPCQPRRSSGSPDASDDLRARPAHRDVAPVPPRPRPLDRLLDEDLRAEHDLSLAEYDALLQLAEAPGRRLRMHQLADRVLLSRSGVTRLIDRLVRDGSRRARPVPDRRPRRRGRPDAGRPGAGSGPPPRTHLRGIADHFVDAIAAGRPRRARPRDARRRRRRSSPMPTGGARRTAG